MNPKRRSLGHDVSAQCPLGHDVSNLVLKTIDESCAFGEDRILLGLCKLTRKSEDFLTLAMSVLERQTKDLRVDAA